MMMTKTSLRTISEEAGAYDPEEGMWVMESALSDLLFIIINLQNYSYLILTSYILVFSIFITQFTVYITRKVFDDQRLMFVMFGNKGGELVYSSK